MHFKIDEIISYISTYIKLDDGDLILTGTPDGVGSVVSGDKVLAYGKVEG
jgi:fumarylpyruvate hydrolase